jgi:hypothetical protein
LVDDPDHHHIPDIDNMIEVEMEDDQSESPDQEVPDNNDEYDQ